MSDADYSESDEDTPVLYAAIVALRHRIQATKSLKKSSRSGSRPGKLPNRDRGRFEGAFKIDLDYHCRLAQNAGNDPVFNEDEFRRRLRIPRSVYEVVRSNLLRWNDPYFTERADACGVPGASTDQKLWVALRSLAEGCSADALVEYGRLAESTNMRILKTFCRGVCELFSDVWLRLPDERDFDRLHREYSRLGFPGAIGCVDVASWYWDLCPMAW